MLISLHDYEAAAQQKLEPWIYDFIAGGSLDELTLQDNMRAFKKIKFHPRVLRGDFDGHLETTLLGHKLSMPILIAPTAFHCLVHPEGEIATARAAIRENIVMIVSMVATTSLSDIHASIHPHQGHFWFQLYLQRDKIFMQDLIQMAEETACDGLVITVDSPVFGRRERDIRHDFHTLPKGLRCENLLNQKGETRALEFNAAFGWDDIEMVRSLTTLPVILKGIQHPDDARLSLENHISALIISNHGGRQLDGTAASINLLPPIADVVQKKIPLILDGGVRRGSDIAKALALGADAVGIGRPILWGLSVNGEDGVCHTLELLRQELIHTLTLNGCRSLSEWGKDWLLL